jgi:hypothetical protein
MRTGIYVYAYSTISIETSEDNLRLEPMAPGEPVTLARSNRVSIVPGVFRVLSGTAVQVVPDPAASVQIISLGDKDKWPDPPPMLVEMISGLTSETLAAFFPMAKGFVP